MVVVGNLTAVPIKMNLGQIILKELQIVGSSGATRGDLEQVVHLVEQRVLKPVVDSVLPLEQANEAHQRMKSKDMVGRIVLRPSL
jgi:alcohol dehydrogenase